MIKFKLTPLTYNLETSDKNLSDTYLLAGQN